MKVKDYNKYRLFDYENEPTGTFELGDILINQHNEIGVVIQTFSDSEVRTDMYGVECNHRLATIEEIRKYRVELL